MPNRHRHRIRSETEANNDRKANHSKQTNERQTRMPNRYRTRSEKEADNSRKGTHSKQTNELHSSMPNRHHTLSEFAKADKGNLKATHRRHNFFFCTRPISSKKCCLKDQPVQRARDGLRKRKYDVEDDSDIPDSGSKELKGHKRRDYADLITLLHLHNPDNFVNIWMTDIE